MKSDELKRLGCPNTCLTLATEYLSRAAKGGLLKQSKPAQLIESVLVNPENFFNDSLASRFAKAVAADAKLVSHGDAPYKIWGEAQIELGAQEQLRAACRLPIAVKGALMPDAHVGYGLPIGGVLATVGSVIPYAVGVDIACRMKLTVTDIDVERLTTDKDKLIKALEAETAFGKGCEFKRKRQHAVMDRDWKICDVTKRMKDTAWSQLGTSGGGNHFVEYGIVTFSEDREDAEANKPYVALLTHSGSRGTGAKVCDYYSQLAMKQLSPKYNWARHLAWLDLESEAGQEYWLAMNLMGEYAAANHDCIHRHILQHLGAGKVLQIENHHNFAWKEIHDGIEMIVHRKGATPAGKGVLGVIPGSMASPAYVVEGLGVIESITSASHGAGRKYSRSHAKQTFSWEHWGQEIKNRGVTLISAGIDEIPAVYKNIDDVMAEQSDLVRTIARFDPKIVKMAGSGEAED